MFRNTASQKVGAQMVNATNGSAFTDTVSVSVTINGVQSAGAGVVTHEGNGFHTYAPTQAETDAVHVGYTFTGTGAIPTTVQVYPVVLNDYADAILKRDWVATETGGNVASRSILNALRFLRNAWGITGSTLSVKKEDDTTEAWNATLTTSAEAQAVTSTDPT